MALKKLILLILILCGKLSQAQVRVVFFNDVPVSYRHEIIKKLEAALPEYLHKSVYTIETYDLPLSAYYSPRGRYRAEKLLSVLDNGSQKTVGVTFKDISTTKGTIIDWGINGLSTVNGTSAVTSLYRLKTIDRLIKVILHELGHTYGLSHCLTKGCLMEEGNKGLRSIDEETGFCQNCKRKLTNGNTSKPFGFTIVHHHN